MVTTVNVAAIHDAVAAVVDPEIRVVTIEDLGILVGVEIDDNASATVTITPTYSGCPAMDVIRADVDAAARRAGAVEVSVRTVLHPAWSTDRISAVGRAKLSAAGIAPPSPVRPVGAVPLALSVRCPRCGSMDTVELSHFGSTACKALRRCQACLEPFDHVKSF